MSIWIIYMHLFVLFATSAIMVNVFEDYGIRWVFVATASLAVITAFTIAGYSLIQIVRG